VLVFFAGKVTPPINAEALNVQKLGELIVHRLEAYKGDAHA